MSRQAEFLELLKNERHFNLAETKYWCGQFKIFAQALLLDLGKIEGVLNSDLTFCHDSMGQEALNKLEAAIREVLK